MPQPVNLNTFSKPRRTVLLRPKCALQIAAIIAEWAYVEEMLAFMFSAAMGSHKLEPDGGASINRNWTALVVMRELDSIHMRLNIVSKTLIPLLPQNLVDEWVALEKVLRARAKERNVAAHTAWAISEQFPEDLISEQKDRPHLRYTEQDFIQILDRVSAAYVQTHDFLHAVLAAQRDGSARIASH